MTVSASTFQARLIETSRSFGSLGLVHTLWPIRVTRGLQPTAYPVCNVALDLRLWSLNEATKHLGHRMMPGRNVRDLESQGSFLGSAGSIGRALSSSKSFARRRSANDAAEREQLQVSNSSVDPDTAYDVPVQINSLASGTVETSAPHRLIANINPVSQLAKADLIS